MGSANSFVQHFRRIPDVQTTSQLHPKSRAEWRRWLEQHQEQKEGVWLGRFKRATGKPVLYYEELWKMSSALGGSTEDRDAGG